MGFGRYVLIRILNALIVLTLVTLVMSALFVKVAEKDLQNRIIEQVNAEFQALQKQEEPRKIPISGGPRESLIIGTNISLTGLTHGELCTTSSAL